MRMNIMIVLKPLYHQKSIVHKFEISTKSKRKRKTLIFNLNSSYIRDTIWNGKECLYS